MKFRTLVQNHKKNVGIFLKKSNYIYICILAVDSWWPSFKNFLPKKKNLTWTEIENEQQFQLLLSDYLFDVDNAKQQANFKFSQPLECGDPAPPILVVLPTYLFHRY